MEARERCPYCGQPITREKLEEITSRIRKDEERRIREALAAQQAKWEAARQRQEAEFRKRSAMLADREQVLKRVEAELPKRARELAKELTGKETEQLKGRLSRAEELLRVERTKVESKYTEGYRKARAEAQRVQERLQKQVDDLQRRLEQKSVDELGAIPEEDLAERLRRQFPEDRITRVPRGAAGADVLHQVISRGQAIGLIVYESKNVRVWQNEFLARAKAHRARYSTGQVILVSTAFPAGERDFCVRDGVPIVHPQKVLPLVDLVREGLIEIARISATTQERETKAQRLFAYVTSEEFGERLKGILEAVDGLRSLQEDERRRHDRTWERQEESYRAIQDYTGKVQAKIAAIAEARLAVVTASAGGAAS